MQASVNDIFIFIARVLLVAVFIWSGYGKIASYDGVGAFMEKFGVAKSLLPLVIAVEIAGGVLLLIGWRTRLVAFALAGFTLLAALLFHADVGDRNQMIHFMKNLAIAGGFLAIFANGAGRLSVDGWRSA